MWKCPEKLGRWLLIDELKLVKQQIEKLGQISILGSGHHDRIKLGEINLEQG